MNLISLKQSSLSSPLSSQTSKLRRILSLPLNVSLEPSPNKTTSSRSSPLNAKPLYQQMHHRLRPTVVQAYEDKPSDRPLVVPIASDTKQKIKISVYFATWWALNVVFNIYNKKVLNAFPFPWLTSTLSLAAGSLIMLISWATRIAEAPKTDMDFWKALAPVRISHLYKISLFNCGNTCKHEKCIH
jgi:solute carrier family 35, member E1